MVKIHQVPTQFIIFGATGDLARKKIFPSLFSLHNKDKLPKLFQIVGFSRRDLNDAGFKDFVREVLDKYAQKYYLNFDPKKIESFLEKISFCSGSFDDEKAFDQLSKLITGRDEAWEVCNNKLFYLSVSPEFYADILNNLKRTGLSKPCSDLQGWSRIIVEKPFGHDLESAKNLNQKLLEQFSEDRIFRIDHYLAKDMLQKIVSFRFLNGFLEPIWTSDFIQKMVFRLWETMGVEDRGAFYEKTGTLMDVGQNHLLQMLAFVVMEKPDNLFGESLRNARAKAIDSLIAYKPNQVDQFTYRLQYEGYQSISEVEKNSLTETYFWLKGFVKNDRFKYLPVTFQAGKRMPRQVKDIKIYFKPNTKLTIPSTEKLGGTVMQPNQVVFELEPHPRIVIKFNNQTDDLEFKLEKSDLSFEAQTGEKREQYTGEYQKMIFDAIHGEQSLFNNMAEVEATWKFVDPILGEWRKSPQSPSKGEDGISLLRYKPNSDDLEWQVSQLRLPKKLANFDRFGLVGLGKMGAGLALNAIKNGWEVVGLNRSPEKTNNLMPFGLIPSYSLEEMINKLPRPRVVWLMLPAGKTVEQTVLGGNGQKGLLDYLKAGDILIEGGNSFFENTKNLYQKVAAKGVKMLDIGVSGGPGGALNGACMMAGGKAEDFKEIENLVADLCVLKGYQFFEGVGAGHFVKMIHNGIEYGMMQAIGEGFNLMKKSDFGLDLERVTKVYNHGSVIESSLIGWLQDGYKKYGQNLEAISGTVKHSGEGQWTVDVAKKQGENVEIIEKSLDFRKESAKNPSYTGQVVSVLRNMFGGHEVGR